MDKKQIQEALKYVQLADNQYAEVLGNYGDPFICHSTPKEELELSKKKLETIIKVLEEKLNPWQPIDSAPYGVMIIIYNEYGTYIGFKHFDCFRNLDGTRIKCAKGWMKIPERSE